MIPQRDSQARISKQLPSTQVTTVTASDRQLLAPLLTTGDAYTFGRAGGSPSDVADLDRIAARLLDLQRDGMVEIVGEPTMDYSRSGDHYYAIRARLTPGGRDALGVST